MTAQGHTIGGLKIDGTGTGYQGFVGYLQGGTIQNLTLGPTCSVTGASYTGGLCGFNNDGYYTYIYSDSISVICHIYSKLTYSDITP